MRPYEPSPAPVHHAGLASNDASRDWRPDPSAVARLLVVEARSEAPAAGVVVVASVGTWSRTARTGLDGRVELEVPVARVSFEFQRPGGWCRDWSWSFDPGEVQERRFEVVPANGGFRGVVVDPDGVPVAGVRVSTLGGAATTDTQGGFVLEGLAEEEHVLCFQKVPERFLEPSSGRLFAEPGGGPLRRFVLRHRVRLEGTVAPVGTGAPTEWIVVVNPAWHWAPHAEVHDGRFVFDRLSGGHEEWVLAWCPDAPGWSVARKVRLEAVGATRVDFTPRGPGAIVGRVVQRGPSSERMWVSAGRWQYDRCSAEVRADGTFELDAVPAGLVRVSAGGASAEVEVETGRTSRVDLVLEGPEESTLEGLVVDADGAPLASARVELVRVGTGEREGASAGKDGRFVVRGLQGGRWQVSAKGGGSLNDELASLPFEVEVWQGRVSEELRLVAGPAARLTLRVVDGGDQPVPFARLRVCRLDGVRDWFMPATDHAGRVELDRLTPRAVRVELADEVYRAADVLERVARQRRAKATRCEPVTVELRPDETSEVVLRIVDAP